jgi:hypothetical protein
MPAAPAVSYDSLVPQILHLRPVIEAGLELLELLDEDPDEASQFGFFGYQNPGGLRRSFAEKGFISAEHGTRAQRMLAEYLFAHTQVNRIVAETEVGNVAEQRALEKPASAEKARCADRASGPENGGTCCPTRFCARTLTSADPD